ncbi:TPR repeat containing protein [Gracilaria domingensis]|nr:TPR repeat containing protein [Gracilaria domingensis]
MAAHELNLPSSLTRVLSEVKSAIWFRIGVLHEDMGDYDPALSAFEKALTHNPANSSASAKAGLILLKKESFTRAIDYLDASVRRDNTNAAAWAALAHCYLMTDDLEHAYMAYHTSLQRKPQQTDPNLWFGIGVLYDRLGMLEEALHSFHSVLTVTPHYQRADEVYYAIGLIHKEQHKYDHAHEYMTKVMSVINNQQPAAYAEALYQIGHIHELAGSTNSAMDAYQRSIQQNANHPKCLQALAVLMSKTGKHDDALSLLQRASRLDQTDAQIFYVMGRVAMATHNYHVAYESYQQAVYRDGKNADFWCAIGVLYFHMRQYRDAMDAYTRAIHINPRLPEVWYDMGTLYELYNQYSDAVDAYQHALQLQANDPLTNERLAIVQRAIATRVAPQQPSALPRTAGPPLSCNPASAMRPHTKADFVARIGALPPPPQVPIAQPTVSTTPSHVPDRQVLQPASSPPSKLPAPAIAAPSLPAVAEHTATAVHPSSVVANVRDGALTATAAAVTTNPNSAGAIVAPVMTNAPVSSWKADVNPSPMDTTISMQEPPPSAVHVSPPKHDRDSGRRNEVDIASQLSSHRSRSPPRPKPEVHPVGPRSPNVSKPSVVDQQTLASQISADNSVAHMRSSQHAPVPISSAPVNTGISSLVNKRSLSPPRSRPNFQEEPDRHDRQEVAQGGISAHSPKIAMLVDDAPLIRNNVAIKLETRIIWK